MTKEEAEALYEGKFFYEIVKDPTCLKLYGPFDNIYYVNIEAYDRPNLGDGTALAKDIKFIQVIDGRPVQAFKASEILVTDHKLGE